jgi:hypothetical protein
MFPKELAELVPWVVFLLPGWVALMIAGMIADIAPSNDIYIVFASFVLSAVSYAIARAVLRLLGRFGNRQHSAVGDASSITPNGERKSDRPGDPPAVYVFIAAGVLGLALGIGLESNMVYTGLRLLPFGLGGVKVGDGGNEQNYFRISVDDGSLYEGIISSYGITDEESDIYVSPACLVKMNGVFSVHSPGVIIFERNVHVIAIIDRRYSECYKKTVLGSSSSTPEAGQPSKP